jgi:ABC-type glutathione transport system ATPase component
MTGLARDAKRTVIFQTPAGTPLMSFITLTKLQKSFGATTVLRSFDLGLEQGAFVSLPGPLGCDKTTVLRLLAGLETPAAGDILIDGQSVVRQRPNQRRIGMVFPSCGHKGPACRVARPCVHLPPALPCGLFIARQSE